MKKQLSFLTNQNGFYLPYVLFIMTIIFLSVTTHVSIYQQNIKMTHQHLEQLKIETISQMAYKEFDNEYPILEDKGITSSYIYPDGIAKMNYHPLDDKKYNLHISIITNDHSKFVSYKKIRYEND